jgi:hypothetical protein
MPRPGPPPRAGDSVPPGRGLRATRRLPGRIGGRRSRRAFPAALSGAEPSRCAGHPRRGVVGPSAGLGGRLRCPPPGRQRRGRRGRDGRRARGGTAPHERRGRRRLRAVLRRQDRPGERAQRERARWSPRHAGLLRRAGHGLHPPDGTPERFDAGGRRGLGGRAGALRNPNPGRAPGTRYRLRAGRLSGVHAAGVGLRGPGRRPERARTRPLPPRRPRAARRLAAAQPRAGSNP